MANRLAIAPTVRVDIVKVDRSVLLGSTATCDYLEEKNRRDDIHFLGRTDKLAETAYMPNPTPDDSGEVEVSMTDGTPYE